MVMYLPGQKRQFRLRLAKWVIVWLLIGVVAGGISGMFVRNAVDERKAVLLEKRVADQKEEIGYLLGCIGFTYGKDASKIMADSIKKKKEVENPQKARSR